MVQLFGDLHNFEPQTSFKFGPKQLYDFGLNHNLNSSKKKEGIKLTSKNYLVCFLLWDLGGNFFQFPYFWLNRIIVHPVCNFRGLFPAAVLHEKKTGKLEEHPDHAHDICYHHSPQTLELESTPPTKWQESVKFRWFASGFLAWGAPDG